jgi:hypothetical protein
MLARINRVSVLRRVAFAWIALGACAVVFVCLFAIAAFFFDMPVHHGETGQLATKDETAWALLLISVVGSIFVATGVLIGRNR